MHSTNQDKLLLSEHQVCKFRPKIMTLSKQQNKMIILNCHKKYVLMCISISSLLSLNDKCIFLSYSLSRRGRTIIFSIHQPKYSIYKLFDTLTLVCRGRLVYHGPAKQHPIRYFINLGEYQSFIAYSLLMTTLLIPVHITPSLGLTLISRVICPLKVSMGMALD